MRILCFTNTPFLYKNSSTNYNGGEWTKSPEGIISRDSKIELL